MKKILIYLIVLIVLIMPKGAVYAQWNGGTTQSGGQVLLISDIGNKSVKSVNSSDQLTVQTAFEIEIKLVEFSSALKSDTLNLTLTTATGNGLLLSLFYKTSQNGAFLNIVSESVFEDITDQSLIEIQEQTQTIYLKVVYDSNQFVIDINGQQTKIHAGNTDEKAVLAAEIICADPSNKTQVLIVSTVLHIKENDKTPAENNIEEKTDEGESGGWEDVGKEEYRQKEGSQKTSMSSLAVAIAVFPVLFLIIRLKFKNKL